jgi:hypothetical protein
MRRVSIRYYDERFCKVYDRASFIDFISFDDFRPFPIRGFLSYGIFTTAFDLNRAVNDGNREFDVGAQAIFWPLYIYIRLLGRSASSSIVARSYVIPSINLDGQIRSRLFLTIKHQLINWSPNRSCSSPSQ